VHARVDRVSTRLTSRIERLEDQVYRLRRQLRRNGIVDAAVLRALPGDEDREQ